MPSSDNEAVSKRQPRLLLLGWSIAWALLLYGGAPLLREGLLTLWPHPTSHPEVTAEALRQRTQNLARIESQWARKIPRGPYLVISTADNTFRLMQGREPVREGLCSTGSYIRLETAHGTTWTFQTPRGRLRVQHKTERPVWSKPDWAFVESGQPVPPPGAPERYERGVLGDYALSLGDGYLVHGTPYQRLLGTPVTHGCVRLGDADLKAVYTTLKPGDPVFIY